MHIDFGDGTGQADAILLNCLPSPPSNNYFKEGL